jgi:GntR family transcriptional repressor for pyruvate dehydrogenase complex
MAEAIRRTSTSEAIVDHLLDRIRSGDYGPGDKLPSERELQAELGVGRLSLREALARLSALGIIRVDHGKGAYVQQGIDSGAMGSVLVPLFPHRSARTLRDLVEARSLVEGEQAALAASRRTAEDLERLRELVDVSEDSLGDHRAVAALDQKFHQEIARTAANEFLEAMLAALSEHVRAFLLDYARALHDPRSVLDRHRPILEAIEAGDADAAREQARRHVDVCKSSLQSYIDRCCEQSAN